MQTYLLIGMLFTALLASSCSAPRPMSIPPCKGILIPGQGCINDNSPTATGTVRGYRDQIDDDKL